MAAVALAAPACIVEPGAFQPQQPRDGERQHEQVGAERGGAPGGTHGHAADRPQHDTATAERRGPFDVSDEVARRCTEMTRLSGDLNEDTTLGPECYEVSGRLEVKATVTIEPGATFVFGSDGGLQVRADGRLRAAGEPGTEIIFTSDERIPGYWRGIRYGPSNSTHNVLRHVVIEYGGSRAWGLRHNRGGPANLSINAARVELDTVTLQHSGEYGLWIRNYEAITMTGPSTITGNEKAAVRTLPDAVGLLNPETSYAGNGDDHIMVRGGDVENAAAWVNFNVPLYVTGTVEVKDDLEIVAGNELIFRQGAGMDVHGRGSLAVDGVSGKPVMFRGEEPIAGFWRGLRFRGSNSLANRLRHVVIRDAGSQAWGLRRNYGKGGLSLAGTRIEVAEAITLKNNDGDGIFLRDDPVIGLDCGSLDNRDGFNVDDPPC